MKKLVYFLGILFLLLIVVFSSLAGWTFFLLSVIFTRFIMLKGLSIMVTGTRRRKSTNPHNGYNIKKLNLF